MKIIKKVFIAFGLIIIVLGIIIALPKSEYEKENPFKTDDLPLVMAHAGGKGVYPDNTMKAYEYSYSIGVDVLEIDVQVTVDDVLVLLHGENETGNMKSHSNCDTVVWKETYEYLYNNCNMGYHYKEEDGSLLYQDFTAVEWQNEGVYLAKLEEVFARFKTDFLYTIEIKADSDAPRTHTADLLYDLIVEYNLEEVVMVATAFDDISEYIVENYPELYISTSLGSARDHVINVYTFRSIFNRSFDYAALQVPISYEFPMITKIPLASKLLIHVTHQHNMAMHYWTINDEDTMRYLIEQGADGIITDYPELLMEVIDEYK